MRTTILAAVSALALTAGAAHAQTVQSGYAGLDYGHVTADISHLGNTDVNVYEGQGAIALPVSGAFGSQLDLDVSHYAYGDSFVDDQTLVSGTAHLFHRNDRGLVGAFAGVEHADHINLWGVGIESQFNAGNQVTLAGNFGYAGTDKDQSPDFLAANGQVRWFPMDNVRVDASVGWLRAHQDTLGHLNAWKTGVGGEYQFAGTPWTLTAGYEYGQTGRVFGERLTTNTVKVGVRWTFGGSLLERDRKGASLDKIGDIYGGSLGQGVLALTSTALNAINNF